MASSSSVQEAGVPPAGLRAWKKARTRLTISNIATGLFMRDGFEAVTVAQIAAAAEVSVKTVFNYFPSKEELFFDRVEDVIGALVDAVVERPAGATVVGALHGVLADRLVPFDDDGWRRLRNAEDYERFRRFLATEEASPALRTRRLVIAELWTARLAQLFAHQLGLPKGDPRAATLAAMVIAVMTLRARTLSAAMAERLSARTVERRVRAVVDEAFERLAVAFADVDLPRPAA
ncbi:TetR/AcrR family transcriptional regulator [Baekduia sp.]|jgi:AcrR family transcriptional regulator|uniref:TetR/AcrR family transcriptional regulator n=1 Tax=Baekduia sp. TaxID=2600305 RepID=UPI002DFD9B43|nr:TetR/AcrR family transcriptional regulator [Baekduia sp.]